MKKHLLSITFLLSYLTSVAQLWSLKAEYDPDIEDICIKLNSNQWAMTYDQSKRNLADIYESLNFKDYNVEIIECNKIKSSAIAYLEPVTKKRYILINTSALQNLDNRYFSHMFVIAHEFAHHKLNHFGSNLRLTLEAKRELELDADKYAASIVAQNRGTLADCIYALNEMKHPSVDTYYDHPSLDKRIAAVKTGVGIIPPPTSPVNYKNYTNLFPDINNLSLLSYTSEVNPWDITEYSKSSGFVPRTISYYKNKYWIYWKKDDNVTNYQVFWNYNNYESSTIKKYFDLGYNVNFIEKVNNKWFVVFCKFSTGQYPQSLCVLNKSDFVNKTTAYKTNVEEYLNKGYVIKNIIPYNISGDLLFILDKKLNEENKWTWAFRDDYNGITNWIKDQSNDGYNYLYTYKVVNSQFFGFMTKTKSINHWTVVPFMGSDVSIITDLITKGYQIGNLTMDNTNFWFTMARFTY
ncbi:hypothetical protein [Pedobacter sp. UBA5917]|jgi:hypothetical protein|uniref:hypothetical protein n=1 Tax=Pedobacter sp. UBA5917 TaxID=1947061 RepID=UPI0025E14AFC|nr:hypothetical protein [Pedobacter sp. UBA5917]